MDQIRIRKEDRSGHAGAGAKAEAEAEAEAEASVETRGLRPRAGRMELHQLLGASLGPVLPELPTQEKPHSQDTLI